MAAGASSPCASCKLLRRRCAKDCIFAPHFPSDDPHKFAIVHKVFGASNVSKMLQIPADHRGDAVSSLVYEANARLRDPVYGCVGAITYLQDQVSQLQMQLAVAQAEILCIQTQQRRPPQQDSSTTVPPPQIQLRDAAADLDDDRRFKSFFVHQQNNHHQCFNNFTPSDNTVILHESFKRAPFFEHYDMVSSLT
ncbi:PREDICTED: LOB domain-containing protein 12-like isoform X2 [Ipomoea nil]|uniref:LOB domain-containing protein 12-like isoform X2 n=1 Tax=Ipomoea nil TaxID=35883 RepID=UPI000900FD2D|nr:PREDICTED: LOB domain-containing protein 12-like isoform X2 [Ipomoea nil]